jgi:hypothetical protein
VNEAQVDGTGVYYRGDRARGDRLRPEVEDGHVWVALAVFRLRDDSPEKAARGERVDLDQENLAMLDVGCFVCEQPWSQRTAHRRCTGEPKDGRR